MSRRRRTRYAGTVAVVALMLSLGPGCAEPPGPEARDPARRPQGPGERLYVEQNCNLCHGVQGQGTSLGPSLAVRDDYWTVDRLVVYLENPAEFVRANPDFQDRRTATYRGAMPAYQQMSVEDRRQLAVWLLEER